MDVRLDKATLYLFMFIKMITKKYAKIPLT
jgi:hypothetical protein